MKNSLQILNKIETTNILEKDTCKEQFIEVNFSDYDLHEYDAFIDLINECDNYNDFFRLLPILLRCLFENLLYDMFQDSLDSTYTELFSIVIKIGQEIFHN